MEALDDVPKGKALVPPPSEGPGFSKDSMEELPLEVPKTTPPPVLPGAELVLFPNMKLADGAEDGAPKENCAALEGAGAEVPKGKFAVLAAMAPLNPLDEALEVTPLAESAGGVIVAVVRDDVGGGKANDTDGSAARDAKTC